MSKQIILIGGMPTAGKSTLAKKLSKHLNLPWISTDQIGIMMRAVAARDEYPKLFTWEDYDGFNYLNRFTADEIVENEFAKSESVWLGVQKLIKDDFAWNKGYIIEGIDILPHLITDDLSSSSNIKAIFISDSDIERVRNVVLTRNFAGDNASTYTDSVKEKEVEWVLKYNERLKDQVMKHGLPWVEVNKNDNDLKLVLDTLGLV